MRPVDVTQLRSETLTAVEQSLRRISRSVAMIGEMHERCVHTGRTIEQTLRSLAGGEEERQFG